MDTAKISFKLTAGYRYDEETGTFVSVWPHLNIYAQGHTEAEAMEALKSTILLYLETCLAHERLDDVLTKAGFSKAGAEIPGAAGPGEYIKIERRFDSTFDIEMEIPLHLIAAEANRAIDSHSASRA